MLRNTVVWREVDGLHVFHVGQVELVQTSLVGVGDVGVAEVMAKVLGEMAV